MQPVGRNSTSGLKNENTQNPPLAGMLVVIEFKGNPRPLIDPIDVVFPSRCLVPAVHKSECTQIRIGASYNVGRTVRCYSSLCVKSRCGGTNLKNDAVP